MKASYKSIILAVSLFFALSASTLAAPGDLDPTFGVGGTVIESSFGFYDVAIQPDGKIVAVGTATGGSEITQIAVARYNIDGSRDMTFGTAGRVFIDHYQIAVDVAIQPDGKIVLATRDPDGDVFGEIVRLNSDGSLDTSFGTNGIVRVFLPSVAATLPDGKLLGATGASLFRLNANGSFDMTFGFCRPGGATIHYPYNRSESVIQTDGKILTAFTPAAQRFGVFRCNADGTLDTGFGSGGVVITPISSGLAVAHSIATQMDGKIVVTGQNQSNSNTDWQLTVVRYNPNGSLDTGFGAGGIVTMPTGITGWNPPLDDVAIQADGKIVAVTTTLVGYNFAVVRYNPNGSLDTIFNVTPIPGNNSASSVAIQADGKIVVAGAGGSGSDFYALLVRYQGDAPPAACPNPIDCADFFVRQQYQDFLQRSPEAGPDGVYGTDDDPLKFYLDILNGCNPADIECIKYTRGALSANFFRSPEFQRKGSYVMYLYMVSIGQRPVTPAELPVKNDPALNDRPHYAEFVADLQSISTPNDDPALTETKKAALADAWMQRAEIQALYPAAPTMSNAQFVQKLLDTAGVSIPNQSQLVADLNAGSKTRAQVLRIIAESFEVNAKFYKAAFVTMEYFGYLRRNPEDCHNSQNWTGNDPNQCGFIFHNNRFNLGIDQAEVENNIVRGFIESPEYRARFGQP